MKTKTIFLGMLFFISSLNIFAQTEQEKIKGVVLDYLEGWYSADTVRMANALSPDLVKRGIIESHETKELNMYNATFEQMIQWTGKNTNKLNDALKKEIAVTIVDVQKYIALVKTETPDFIDYIELGKLNGEWKIYNVLWELNK